MTVTYCERWWFARSCPIGTLHEADAKSRHNKQEGYTAVTWEGSKPAVIVDFASAWVSVNFLNERQLQFLSYDFQKTESGRLFLKTAVHREFTGNGAETSVKVFGFHEDGSIDVEERLPLSGEKREFKSRGNVSTNWEAYPEFGEYAAVCRVDRDISALG